MIPNKTLHAGSITYHFYANRNITDPVVYAAYGYNTVTSSPSVSFSGVSISVNDSMVLAGSARVYAE